MGIDTNAVLIIGLPSEELGGDCDYYYEVLEELGLDRVSPYYDSDYNDCTIGIIVARSDDYAASEVEGDLNNNIQEAMEKFFTLTGKSGKLFISPRIW